MMDLCILCSGTASWRCLLRLLCALALAVGPASAEYHLPTNSEKRKLIHWSGTPTHSLAAHCGYFVPLTKLGDFLKAGVRVKVLLAGGSSDAVKLLDATVHDPADLVNTSSCAQTSTPSLTTSRRLLTSSTTESRTTPSS